ncbi:MAG: quinolinate synthase NadA [Nitrospinota bacterium]
MADAGTAVCQAEISEKYLRMPDDELTRAIWRAKEKLGKRLTILGHHYQRDDVIQFADFRGDSLKLSQQAAATDEADYIVFCGVHFMAETADILTAPRQKIILPDINAGCSMADMAGLDEVEECWDYLTGKFGDSIIPVTYVNSTAEIKAFVGERGGLTCTSSNAHKIMEHAFKEKERILFLPDQHLGRNTAYKLGVPLNRTAVYDPMEIALEFPHGQSGADNEGDDEADGNGGGGDAPKVILWKGHCSVHMLFTPHHIRNVRERHPGVRVLVHPECTYDVVLCSDENGSTSYIVNAVKNAPAGTKWAIGTEHNLTHRLAAEHPEQEVMSLNPMICPCITMNRIDRPHLLWSLESLLEDNPVNVIEVPEDVRKSSRLAIDRMMALS